MPLSPSGVYTLPNGYLAVTGQDILPSQHNPPLEDIGSVLSEAFYRTGVAPMLANLNFNTFKGVGLGNGTAATDAINKSQLDGLVTFPNASAINFTLGDVMVQFGSTVVTTNGSGNGTVGFSPAFSAVPNVIATNGDGFTHPTVSVILLPAPAGIDLVGFNFGTHPTVVSSSFRINWVAIGSRT